MPSPMFKDQMNVAGNRSTLNEKQFVTNFEEMPWDLMQYIGLCKGL